MRHGNFTVNKLCKTNKKSEKQNNLHIFNKQTKENGFKNKKNTITAQCVQYKQMNAAWKFDS